MTSAGVPVRLEHHGTDVPLLVIGGYCYDGSETGYFRHSRAIYVLAIQPWPLHTTRIIGNPTRDINKSTGAPESAWKHPEAN